MPRGDEVGDPLAIARNEDEQVRIQPVGHPRALGLELIASSDEELEANVGRRRDRVERRRLHVMAELPAA